MCIYICIKMCIYNIHDFFIIITTTETIICHCRDLYQSRTEKSIAAAFSTPGKILNFFWQIFKFSINSILYLMPAEISFCFISLSILQVSTTHLWLRCFNLLLPRSTMKQPYVFPYPILNFWLLVSAVIVKLFFFCLLWGKCKVTIISNPYLKAVKDSVSFTVTGWSSCHETTQMIMISPLTC